MLDNNFIQQTNGSKLEPFVNELLKISNNEFNKKNGNKKKWQQALDNITINELVNLQKNNEYLLIDSVVDKQSLQELKPWRKGPFAFKNFKLDSEWNGDIKWQRIQDYLDFQNKTILDVGCGNGYFSLLMGMKNAKFVLGLEPFLLFNYQFRAIKSLIKNVNNTFILPLRLEQAPNIPYFDIVFSMGVLYHHKSPIEHILKLKKMLAINGKLILETLIVEGEEGYSLMPKDRYAAMRNVWFIPSIKTLTMWLKKCGFNSIVTIDDSITDFNEQRKTEWIGENSKSLIDFVDDALTIEGYPRPRRLMLLCD